VFVPLAVLLMQICKQQITNLKFQTNNNDQNLKFETFWLLNIGIWNLPFDVAQGGESFDVAQDREPVERPVEPFVIWCL
jgi:hypothetical protein